MDYFAGKINERFHLNCLECGDDLVESIFRLSFDDVLILIVMKFVS